MYALMMVLPGIGTSIQEAIPSYPSVLLRHYGLTFAMFLGGLVFAIKRRDNSLLITWCIFMLLLTLGQRRWSYYFTVNNAIMASFFIFRIHKGLHKEVRIGGVIVICSFLVFSLLPSTISLAQMPNNLSEDWYNACIWIKENTPEVTGYYDLEVEKLDYGVVSWWDYGNWITRIGHRAPISNPMAQTPSTQWEVLLAKSEEEANSFLDGIEYIMVDLAMVTSKFYAIVRLSPYTQMDWEPFVVKLWNEETTSWTKIHQEGVVKIYGRS
jgi:dolichyl-diphosphooligosaccharide--protein glycosyltransferase